MNKTINFPITKLSFLIVVAAIFALALSALQPANAQGTACQGSEYVQGGTYNGGDIVYMNGNNYSAKWWTQQTPPGSEWNDMGACTMPGSGDGTTEPGNGTTAPGGEVGECAGVPFDPTISNYNTGDIVYLDGMNYEAKFWVASAPPGGDWIEIGPCTAPPPAPALEGPVKIYYFVEWGVYGRDFHVGDLAPLVEAGHINVIQYSFIDVNAQGDCVLFDQWAADERPGTVAPYNQPGNLRQMSALRDDYAGELKVVLSLGGWTLSGNFSDVANDDAKRANMVDSCVAMMRQYRFDGLDIDWEYPGGGGLEGNSVDEANDARAFVELMRDLRAALDVAEEEDGGAHYYLTAALPVGEDKFNHIEMANAAQYMDYLSVMSYDMNGAWQEMPAHNAPLYANPADPRVNDPESNSRNYNIEYAMDMYLNGGMNVLGEVVQGGTPPEKLVMGLAFYGRSWSNVPPTEVIPGLPGLFGTSNVGTLSFTGTCNCEPDYSEMSSPMWPNGGSTTAGGSWEESVFDYDDIHDTLIPSGGYTRYWDDASKVPYAYNPNVDGGTLISYDDMESIQIKAEYVAANCLGGIMVWETSTNSDSTDLYDAVATGLGDYDPADCETLIDEITNPPVDTGGSDIPLAVNVASDSAVTGSLTPLLTVLVVLIGVSALRLGTKRG